MTRSPHRALLIYAQNKMPYGLFIADTGTPTHETICTLIDILEDQHITPGVSTKFGTVHQRRHNPCSTCEKTSPNVYLPGCLTPGNHRNQTILTLVSTASFAAPSFRVVPGPIARKSTAANTKPPGITSRSSPIKMATLRSSPLHMLVVCTISRRFATPGC